MKPNFALGLTDDGVTLWQRDPDGWLRVGAVPLDAPDLDAKMAELSRMAAALAPEGVRTKLVVPVDQLMACELSVTARNPEMQAHEIRAQLTGRTPYPADELDFDWTVEDGTARVVVVARETLAEAEDFAQMHGLNPVCSVAADGMGQLTGEPFFGATRSAGKVLDDPAQLERDATVLRETGVAKLPELPATPEPEPAAPEATSKTEDAPEDSKAPTPSVPAPEAPRETLDAATTDSPPPELSPAEARKAALMARMTAGRKPTAEPISDKTEPTADDPGVAFRSRRASSAPEAEPTDSFAAKLAATGAEAPKPAKGALARALGAAKNITSSKKPAAADSDSTAAPPSQPAVGGDSALKERPKVNIPARKGPLETLRTRADDASEAERMTIFGARDGELQELSTRRRTLLVLGGVGLLLAAVAVWVAYFTFTSPATQIAEEPALTEEAADLATPLAEPGDDPLMIAEGDTPGASDDIESALGLEEAAQQQPLETPLEEFAEDTQPDTEREETPSVTGGTAGRVAELRSAALLAPQDAVPLPSAPDAPLPFADQANAPSRDEVAALAAEADTAEPEAATPLEDALPEGEDALEIAVTQGTPPSVPPTRPEGIAPEPVEEAVVEEAPEPEAVPTETAVPDAELATPEESLDPLDESALDITVTQGPPAATPPARPEGLTPATAPAPEVDEDVGTDALEPQQEDDQASLETPPPGGVALTALRPATRPESVIETATEAAAAAQAMADASQFAVASSARPSNRPSQFSAVVQRTMAARAAPAAPSAPAAQTQPTQAAAQTALRIPTSASVAREATQTRAINLRQVNLIGVMGTSSSRRALVRLSNGRIVTVRVGESLDGGQVTTISENELRYTRRGRNVVLRLAS